MKNSNKRQKQGSRVDRRGEAVLDHAQCQCGCQQWDLLDVRHGQIYIKGHGGSAIMERRKVALSFAIEVKLIALGAGVLTAERAAKAFVARGLKLARRWIAQFGYDYLAMTWRTA